jgi:integrase
VSTSRYQLGSLEKRKSAQGLTWYLRFHQTEGEAVQRPRVRVGLVAEFSTKAELNRALEKARREFNTPEADKPKPVALFRHLVEQYELKEMPERYSTSQSYQSMVRVHILPKWGHMPVAEVRPGAVKDWLLGLHTVPRKPHHASRPLAPKTIGHVRGLMSVLFRYAMLHDYIPAAVNPMTLFPLSTARLKEPRILTVVEFKNVVIELTTEPFRTMVITAGCLGLSCSELIGIRWEDVDWIGKKDGPAVSIRTGVVNGRVGGVKNKFRKKPLPLHLILVKVLQSHFQSSEFRRPDDWVFASPHAVGESPYNPGDVLKKYIRPAAIDMEIKRMKAEKGNSHLTSAEYAHAIALGKEIGWHTFRHSYRAWLGDSGAKMEIQRDLMRHSNISTAIDTYGGTFPEGLREANAKVVEGLLQ